MSASIVPRLTEQLAARLGVEGESALIDVIKATAFRGPVSDAQMTALLIVANQYGLNPWTKEIYAFPDSSNGIVPVVGVDGWARIINSSDVFDGMDFTSDDSSCTCTIYRKDRAHPTRVTEYMSECRRETKPWKSHPHRMLRHKAMIQCARIAFGFGGIYDQDEAERIVANDSGSPTDDSFDLSPAISRIVTAEDMDALQAVFTEAWRDSPVSARKTLTAAKDKRKAYLLSQQESVIDGEVVDDAAA